MQAAELLWPLPSEEVKFSGAEILKGIRDMKSGIYVVGIGPGKKEYMTHEAESVLGGVDVIVGYTVYVDLVRSQFPGKEFMTTPMKQEMERCRICFEKALEGKSVALVCSGDAGVYGMASPVYQLAMEEEKYRQVRIQVVGGITAALSGAAVLGCPLNHDFCVISLSDLLTPWERIEKRLAAAAVGDFAIAIYNPSSIKRSGHLARACRILMDNGASPKTVCGYVRNIGRDETCSEVCTLDQLAEKNVDMFTTVFVGNSQSRIHVDSEGMKKIVTMRGYSL